ncbi:hypothetical protein R3W88_000994 [Solanum pinnatisectum]|uniref:Uncharacterized protein n=1 Tax=Solanum pinnatisectum TaxID=50273 RepID=A0AAV9MJ25_9SOLN|nr:hypothetical protein R3W88_000994 [Solanum pinnatisectum]
MENTYIGKSLDETIVKNLWQFVSRKKIQKEKMREGLDSKGDHVKYVDNFGNENIVGNIEQSGEKSMSTNNVLPGCKLPVICRGVISTKGDLQKRKNIFDTDLQVVLNKKIERSSHRIFGRIPDLQTNVPNQTHGDPEFPPVNTNNIFVSSTEQQLYHPQLQVQQHYLISFLSGQNNDGGSQGPIIGRSNSNFYMPFNSGDHHDFNLNRQTQNDYNLDLNQTYVTTNSTSAIMTDMNGENAIINGSGEANTNFHNFIAISNTSANEGSDLNEWENCDAYLNFHNMDDLYHNIGVSSSILPNENGNEYDQVYSIDQVCASTKLCLLLFTYLK